MRSLLSSRAGSINDLFAVVSGVFVSKVVFPNVSTFAEARSNGLNESTVVPNACALGGSNNRGRGGTTLLATRLAFLVVEFTDGTGNASRF